MTEHTTAGNDRKMRDRRKQLKALLKDSRLGVRPSDVAIIGVSGTYPKADTYQELWDLIQRGETGIGPVPEDRWQADAFYDPDPEKAFSGKTCCRWGGFIDDPFSFDAALFNIPADEAARMDPQVRKFLQTAWAVMEDAGYAPLTDAPRRIGVFAGITSYTHETRLLEREVGGDPVYPSTNRAAAANRVSHFFNLTGPSIPVDAECASSLTAIHLACRSLAGQECDMAIAGGVNLYLHPSKYVSLSRQRLLAHESKTRSFGEGGAGFVPGEGIGAVLLKPLAKALVDADHIHGVIRGGAVNNWGRALMYGAPNPAMQTQLVVDAVRDAKVDPDAISYVEAQGLGTEVADAMEVSSLAAALQQLGRKHAHPIPIGSIKPNIGHPEAASGIAQLTKVLLQMRHGLIAPSLFSDPPNPSIDFTAAALRIQTELGPWQPFRDESGTAPRRALITSFGAGGTGACLVVDAFPIPNNEDSHGEKVVIPLSAANREALKRAVLNLLAWLKREREFRSFSGLAFTLQTGRTVMPERLAAVVETKEELIEKLDRYVRGESNVPGLLTGTEGAPAAPDEPASPEDSAGFWVSGGVVDWTRLYKDRQPIRVPLPAYPFAGTIHDVPSVKTMEPPSRHPAPVQGAAKGAAAARRVLTQLISEALDLPGERIDTSLGFTALGLDSKKLVALTGRLNAALELDLRPVVFFEFPDIKQLAEHLARMFPEKFTGDFKAGPVPEPRPALRETSPACGRDKKARSAPHDPQRPEPVAVIGLSLNFPGADSFEKFMENLAGEKCAVVPAPDDRWDEGAPGSDGVFWGGFIPGIAAFDPRFFGISPREAELMDPQQRLLMMHIYKAIEDAGYSPSSLSGTRTGIFTATGGAEYLLRLQQAGVSPSGYSAAAIVPSLGPNRMSYFLNLKGPSEPVETACSSSLVAIHRAVAAIERGECRLALAGGVNTIISPYSCLALERAGMLSPDGLCKTFSARADGYVRGEGIGILLLKGLSEAEKDNDHIYALIRGTAVSHAGRSSGLTAPNPRAQAEVVKAAVQKSGVAPETITYIETHGTGTRLGDPAEIQGLKRAFRELHRPGALKDAPAASCALGSVKSNIGHLELAAGIAGLIKVIAQLRRRTIFKTLYATPLNPDIDLSSSPFYIANESGPWEALQNEQGVESPRRAGVSSFGMGGVNAHVVLEEYRPSTAPRETRPINGHTRAVIPLSARNEDRLADRARQLLEFISTPGAGDLDLPSIAFTLQSGRDPMEARLAVSAASIEELANGLKQFLHPKETSPARERVFQGGCPVAKESSPTSDPEITASPDGWMSLDQSMEISKLWVNGNHMDWTRLYQGAPPTRTSLPAYPFSTDRFWIPAAKPSPGTAPEAPFKNDRKSSPAQEMPADCTLFSETWTRAGEAQASRSSLKQVIVFCNDPDERLRVEEAFSSRSPGTALIFISRGRRYEALSPSSYLVGGADLKGYCRAFLDISRAVGPVCAVLDLWALADEDISRDPAHLVSLIQAMAVTGLAPARFLTAGRFSDNLTRCHLDSWIGLAKSLPQILPKTRMAVSIWDASEDEQTRAGLILDELSSPVMENALFLDGGRHTLKISPAAPLSSTGLGPRPGGAYLITGGTGRLGLLLAEYLGAQYRANLVLTGRRPKDSLEAEAQNRIKALEAASIGVIYVQADACDSDAMTRAFQAGKEAFGAVNGVIHLAGVASDLNLADISLDEVRQVLAPKVRGALALDRAAQAFSPEFICYFSSASAMLGDAGAGCYAMANRFQTAFARYGGFSQNGCVTALHWSMWDITGAGKEVDDRTRSLLNRSGQRTLTTAEGLAAFEILAAQNRIQPLVLAGDPDRINRLVGAEPVPGARAEKIERGRLFRSEMAGLATAQCIERDLKREIGELLKIPRDQISASDNLEAVGFDSVGLVELAEKLSTRYGITLPPSVFFGYATVAELTRYLLEDYREVMEALYGQTEPVPERAISRPKVTKPRQDPSDTARPSGNDEPIAIIGLSGLFPDARNLEQMWDILVNGREAVGKIPSDRFDPDKYARGVWTCGCVPGVFEFDPLFFEISPNEARSMDPRQRLLLQTAWNALEDAGLGQSHPAAGRIGMFVGVEQNNFKEFSRDIYHITSNHNAVLASRLSYFLDLDGPVMSINTACSSGLTAVHQACLSLRNNECETALAAGVNLILTPDPHMAMEQAGMLSPDGRCYAFDRRANGLTPGEAVVVAVLKPLSRALADGDPVHAVIRGSGINYDGRTNGITAPNGKAQEKLIRSVWGRCKISGVDYLISHGTGTLLGDPVEANALGAVFKYLPKGPEKCAVTSVKGNFGHCLAASGLVSLAAMVQAMHHKTIPAGIHVKEENPHIDWKGLPLYINTENRPWEDNGRGRIGAVSAFGISGTNVHMVIESAPSQNALVPDLPYVIFCISAKSGQALTQKLKDLGRWMGESKASHEDIYRAGFTLMAGRRHFRRRCAVVLKAQGDGESLLREAEAGAAHPHIFRGKAAGVFSPVKKTEDLIRELARKSRTLLDQPAEYLEILLTLAEFYCQGYHIPYDVLYGHNHVPRIHLPSYPFKSSVYPPPGAALAGADSAPIHPLIHTDASTPDEIRFSSVFSGDEPFISDHKIRGKRIFPGSACLEMARAAVVAAQGPGAGRDCIRLRDVVWQAPMLMEPETGPLPRPVHITLSRAADRTFLWEIADLDDDGANRVCCRGKALVDGKPPAAGLDVAGLKTQFCRQRLSSKECYNRLAGLGFEYGPAFQGLAEIHAGEDQVLAKLDLGDAGREFQEGLSPGLVDAVFQAGLGLFDETARFGLRPYRIEEMEIFGPGSEKGWAHVRRKNKNGGDSLLRADIDLADETGRLYARIKGFVSIAPDHPEKEALVLVPGFMNPAEAARREDGASQLTIFCEWEPAPRRCSIRRGSMRKTA